MAEDNKLKGINLLTEVDLTEEKLQAKYNQANIMSIPFSKINNTAFYNGNEIEIDIPFEEFNEQNDVLCGVRLFVPSKTDQVEEQTTEPAFAETLHSNIRVKSKIEENVGDLLCTLPDLPLAVPRGKYTADLFRDNTKAKGELRLHGSTFSYKINFKNIVKAFLLPQNDDTHINLVLGFDKPLRQGNTAYPYIIFQFSKSKESKVDLKLSKEELAQIHPDLEEQYEGKYYEIVAKLFKLTIGINIIIPGEFKTSSGHPGLKCHVGNQEGLLFPLNKSLIFIKKPVIYLRLDDIACVEFHRVSGGHGVRGFDFEVRLRTGISTAFSGADRKELELIRAYFEKNKVETKTVDEIAQLEEALGGDLSDDDHLDINDDDEEGDEEEDGSFVASDDDEGDDEDGDGDYVVEDKKKPSNK